MTLLSATVSILVLYVSITNGQNTGVRVVFDSVTPNSYTEIENAEELMVCIRVEGTISQQFSVTLNTFSAGSATAGGVDYTDTMATHTFILFSTLTRCMTITINDDSVLEGTEFFFISVSSDDSSVEIPPLATVSITNDDTMVIGFNQTSYSAMEGTPGKTCVVIVSGSIARSVSFTVTQTRRTASGDDYIPGPLTGSITVANEPVCVNLPLNTDSIVEDTETVLLTVSSADSPTTDTTTLNILDDDGVTVQLASTQLSVVEGNSGTSSLSLCVLLTDVQDNLDRDVTLLLNTQPSSADTSDFVSLVDQPLAIPMTTGLLENVCFQLAVNGDSFIFNSLARYSCEGGYDISGASVRICRSTGSWSAIAPTCQPVDCMGLNNPANGMVAVSGTTFTHTATYSCLSGFALIAWAGY
ncbi:uncharacterized protein LOC135343974 isoform X1 [Halichondria panicea]|uniref:uncharacterized protein LOC135343974 isoform X1 n=1 Tax=Halichondria panicea TaxID=6063 RepID=UPI00312BBBDE